MVTPRICLILGLLTLLVSGNLLALTTQTISGFGPFSAIPVQDLNFYQPTSSSGLPVTVSVLSGPATLTVYSNYSPAIEYLTISGAGTIVLQASVPGNSQYDPLTQTATFVVTDGT